MPATLPHTFADGPGNTASGVEVMDNFNAVNAGVFAATVTSLPSSPVNGQDCYYLADATLGVVWHLKYRSASASLYKWEFVGGSPLTHEIATLQARNAATYADLTTAGPQVTVPLAGEYLFVMNAAIEPVAVANNVAYASLSIGGTTPIDADAIVAGNPTATGALDASVSRTIRRTVSAAAVVAKMQYKSTGTNNNAFYNRNLSVVPARVG